MITFLQAKEKLAKYGQEHVLKYYDELSEAEKEGLLAQIETTDMSVVELCGHEGGENRRGRITPLTAMQLAEIQENKASFTETGVEAIRQGKVGAVLLAGGMGTRLGSDDPKGMYNVGLTKELFIFQCLFHNLIDVVDQVGRYIHLFVMTSDRNHEATVNFLTEKKFFGYREEYVHFFKQEMTVVVDENGKIFMEDKGRLSVSPNGNGGWFLSMRNAGLMDLAKREGVEWLNIFSVDNVLQRIADPCFVGAVIQKGCVAGAKVVKKSAPDEKVGAMCLEDGRPSIVEYYEMTEELLNAKDEKGEPAYNFGVILNYLFSIEELSRISGEKLPLHVVRKKASYLNEEGRLVKPEEPNGVKFESLVLDMIHRMKSCLPYEVLREKEFAPIKNETGIDSVESARELLKRNGVEL